MALCKVWKLERGISVWNPFSHAYLPVSVPLRCSCLSVCPSLCVCVGVRGPVAITHAEFDAPMNVPTTTDVGTRIDFRPPALPAPPSTPLSQCSIAYCTRRGWHASNLTPRTSRAALSQLNTARFDRAVQTTCGIQKKTCATQSGQNVKRLRSILNWGTILEKRNWTCQKNCGWGSEALRGGERRWGYREEQQPCS